MRYRLIDIGTIFRESSEESEVLEDLDPRAIVLAWGQETGQEVDTPEEADGFVFVKRREIKGWVLQDLLGEVQRREIEPADSVVACIAAQTDLNELEETAPWFVAADFLIARALFETRLSNTVPQASGQDSAGPLVVSREEWDAFMKGCPLAAEFTANGWNSPIEQIWAAAYRMRRDAEAISLIKRQAGVGTDDEPFLPNLRDLFHAYLTNSPKAAVAIMDARAKADQAGQAGKKAGDRPIAEVLDEALTKAEVDAILDGLPALAKTRAKPVSFGTRAAPVSLIAAVAQTASALSDLLDQASKLISKHAPDALVATGPAPRDDPAPGPQPGVEPAVEDPGEPAATGPAGGPLGILIAAHESGKAGYNAFNRGRAGKTPGNIDFSSMTLRQVIAKQALPKQDPNRLFAVGKYQIIPKTMLETVQALRVSPDQKFTPELQEFLFRVYLIGRKRPAIRKYVAGAGGNADLRAAQLALAQEFASVACPGTGRSFYDKSGGNAASISAAEVAKALAEERQGFGDFQKKGKPPDEAWMALCGIPGSGVPASLSSAGGSKPATGPSRAAAAGKSGLNIAKAVQHLRANALQNSSGRCARFVRLALAAGGVNIDPHPLNAREYKPFLLRFKFTETPEDDFEPQAGDIVVIQPCVGGNSAGHIAMYSGTEWISDFKQRGIWPGQRYRDQKPPRALFRP